MERLIVAILERALLDYKILADYQLDYIEENRFRYSVPELEMFFKSDWCAKLMKQIGIRDPEAVYEKMKTYRPQKDNCQKNYKRKQF